MKRHISEIFDNLTPSTSKIIGQYGIKTELDEVTKRRIYNGVMSEINARQSSMPKTVKKKFNKVAVIAAACIATMAIGGISAGAAALHKSFTDYKPAYTEEQKKIVEQATFDINKSTSCKGLTFTATKGMCDGNKFFLLTEVEVEPTVYNIPEGDKIGVGIELHMSGNPEDTNGYSAVYGEMLERNGNLFTLLSVFDMGDISDTVKIGISYSGLSNRTKQEILLAEEDGRWGVSFTATKNKFAKSFESDSTIKFAGYDAKVSNGYIAPWYASFDISANGSDEALMSAEPDKLPDVKIVMNDGTTYTNSNGINVVYYGQSGSGCDEEGYNNTWEIRCTFKDYIETSEIKSLEVNSAKVDVKDVELAKALGYENL